jgi:hypothetical protein
MIETSTRHSHPCMAHRPPTSAPCADAVKSIHSSGNDHMTSVSAPSPPLTEIERVQERVRDFNWRRSQVWAHLTWAYGPIVTQEELVSLATMLSKQLRIRLDRDARRRKPVMIKWFEENWYQIFPCLRFVTLTR